MSASAVQNVGSALGARTARNPESRRAPASLRLVAPPAAVRSRTPFFLTCALLLALTLVGLLLLNISLSRGAYQVHELEYQRTVLQERQQALQEQLAAEQTPQKLAERAASLGMVVSEHPAGLRLTDGAVLGEPAPAVAPSGDEQ